MRSVSSEGLRVSKAEEMARLINNNVPVIIRGATRCGLATSTLAIPG